MNSTVRRTIGVITPAPIVLLWLWLESRLTFTGEDVLIFPFGFIALGALAGLLIRRWWAVFVVPATVFATLFTIFVIRHGTRDGETTLDVIAALLLLSAGFPIALGVVVGTVIAGVKLPEDL